MNREFYIPFRVLPPHASFTGKQWPEIDETVAAWSKFCGELDAVQLAGPILTKVTVPCTGLNQQQIDIALRNINDRNYIGTLSDDKHSITIEPMFK